MSRDPFDPAEHMTWRGSVRATARRARKGAVEPDVVVWFVLTTAVFGLWWGATAYCGVPEWAAAFGVSYVGTRAHRWRDRVRRGVPEG